MKTVKQIEKKIENLKSRIIKKVKSKGMYENLGYPERTELGLYIGDDLAYEYEIRMQIYAMIQGFTDRCQNYTGR